MSNLARLFVSFGYFESFRQMKVSDDSVSDNNCLKDEKQLFKTARLLGYHARPRAPEYFSIQFFRRYLNGKF
jgi:hypothetical protein